MERCLRLRAVPSWLLSPEETAMKTTTKHTRMSSKGAGKLHKGGTFQVNHGRLARRGATVVVEDSRPARRGSSDCSH
jgi:hypothetical protein